MIFLFHLSFTYIHIIYVDSHVRDDINHVAFGNKFNSSPVAEKYWPSARSIGRPSGRTCMYNIDANIQGDILVKSSPFFFISNRSRIPILIFYGIFERLLEDRFSGDLGSFAVYFSIVVTMGQGTILQVCR